MNWIVFSDNDPELLHLHLETASIHLPYGKPTVVMPAPSGDTAEAYCRLATRFSVRWRIVQGDSYKPELVDILTADRGRDRGEAMTLLTDTRMYFDRMANMRATWEMLQDKSVLGVSLIEAPSILDYAMLSVRRGNTETSTWRWNWPDACQPFALGRTYRTSDLMGPVCQADWSNPSEFGEVFEKDPVFATRPDLAGFGEASLKRLNTPRTANAISMYLRNFSIDVNRLSDDVNTYHWKPYGGL